MRILHWLMAAMVLSMLFIGAAMVSSLANYHRLVSIHRPLGILVLVVVIIRYVNRKFSRLPPFPVTMSQRERQVASYYELLLYTLMFVMPLIGWAMLSAGNYPIVMYGSDSPAANSPGEPDALCDPAPDAHNPRVSAIRDISSSLQPGDVSHAGRAGPIASPHAGMKRNTRRASCPPGARACESFRNIPAS